MKGNGILLGGSMVRTSKKKYSGLFCRILSLRCSGKRHEIESAVVLEVARKLDFKNKKHKVLI